MSGSQNENQKFEKLKRVIADLSNADSYSEFQSLCNEVKFQMVVNAIEENGSIKKAAKSLGYKSNATLFHTIDTKLGVKPENYQLDTIQGLERTSPQPPSKYRELLNDFLSLVHDRESFDQLHQASTKFLLTKRLRDNDYKSQQTADDLGIAKSSLNRATKKLGIDTSKKKKFPSLDSGFFTEENGDAVYALIQTSTFQTLKQAYKEAQKQHIHNAFTSETNNNMADIVAELGHERNAIIYSLENLFDIQYTTVEDTKEKIRENKPYTSEQVRLFTDNSTDLKTLHNLYIDARSTLIIDALERHDYVSARAAEEIGIDRSRMSIHIQAIEQNIELKKLSSQLRNEEPAIEASQKPQMFGHNLGSQTTDARLSIPHSQAPKQTAEQEIQHNFESNDQVLKFLVDHFDYNELKELKAETTKALIATSMKENDFDIDKSADKLGLDKKMLVNGLKNYFNIQITAGLTPETIQEKLDRGINSSKHHSTVRDILPGITSHHELSGMFAEAQKLSILNEWHANNKNTAITANNLGISDSTVIKVLPQIDFD